MKLLSSLALAIWISAVSMVAAAQPPGDEADREGARFLHDQGVELIDQQDWSRAADRFRTALRMHSRPATRYHLAHALLELGQLNEAEEHVVALLGDDETSEPLRERALELKERIETLGGQLSIRIEGPVESLEVFLDDRAIPDSRWRSPMTVSIGAHVIEARQQGEVLAREDATVTREERAEVVLDVRGAPAFELESASETSAAPADAGSSLTSDWRFWAAVGGGVVVVAVVIAVIAVAAGGANVEDPIVGNFEPGVLRWE